MNLILDVLYVSNDRPCCPFWYIISGTIYALSKRQTICEENTVLYLQNRSKEHSKIEAKGLSMQRRSSTCGFCLDLQCPRRLVACIIKVDTQASLLVMMKRCTFGDQIKGNCAMTFYA
ncbi:hypothetical protein PVAP13_9KG138585 [Panicum virgatum]|uniref:Uncharacterized protein n=1 Tax=Panicum virgatum TaxID=38727 RepID=A0A8T0NIE7_PANVG|nr:hypothetical protein PVAP13_9KG138585 [Panicum virgatum]